MYSDLGSFQTYLGGVKGVQSLLPDSSERDDRMSNALSAASARINGVLAQCAYDVPVTEDAFSSGAAEGMLFLSLIEMQISGGTLLAGIVNTPRESLVAQYREAVTWLKDMAQGNVTIAGLRKKNTSGVATIGEARTRLEIGNRLAIGDELNSLRSILRNYFP